MMTKREGYQLSMVTISMDEVVPEDHFLRQLEAVVDFSFIYEELAPYYCANNGKASVDPVVIVKQLLIGFLYGISSERRLEEECVYNVAYRWFLGLRFDESVPDHSTISQLRRRKFDDADLFKKLFVRVLKLCVEAGLVSGRLLLNDSTHVKANASKTSKTHVIVERKIKEYFERLDAYEAEERNRLGMPEITRKPLEPKQTEQTKSTTDTEAGWLCRPGKPDGFHYLAHQTVDAENGIIVDVDVTAGSIDTLLEMGVNVEAVGVDSSYDTAIIHKELDKSVCEKCLAPSQSSRKIQVNIFQGIVDKHHEVDGSPEYNDALIQRQVWCEGTFSSQKSQHNLKQLFRRGLKAAVDHCFLSACAINLKRLAKSRMKGTRCKAMV